MRITDCVAPAGASESLTANSQGCRPGLLSIVPPGLELRNFKTRKRVGSSRTDSLACASCLYKRATLNGTLHNEPNVAPEREAHSTAGRASSGTHTRRGSGRLVPSRLCVRSCRVGCTHRVCWWARPVPRSVCHWLCQCCWAVTRFAGRTGRASGTRVTGSTGGASGTRTEDRMCARTASAHGRAAWKSRSRWRVRARTGRATGPGAGGALRNHAAIISYLGMCLIRVAK
jgi:hypothetical protein